MTYKKFLLLAAMIFLIVGFRLADLGWNFAPVGAVALFAGATFRSRWLALLLPVFAMFISDIALGYLRHDFAFYTFHPTLPVVYGCYVVYVFFGFGIRRHWNRFDTSADQRDSARDHHERYETLLHRRLPVVFGTLGGALLFFLVTNFANWVVYYPKTWNSLAECYWLAIPFFRNTLSSDVIGVTLLFGAYDAFCRRAEASDPTGLLHAR